jgi:hypothetical protein
MKFVLVSTVKIEQFDTANVLASNGKRLLSNDSIPR